MAEPTVQVPVSVIERATVLLEKHYAGITSARLRALLSQPTPSAEPGTPGWEHLSDAEKDTFLSAHPTTELTSIEDMAPGTHITGRSTVTGIWMQTTVETSGTLIIGDTHWGASVLDPSTIRDAIPPAVT